MIRRFVLGLSILLLAGCGASAVPVEFPEPADQDTASICRAIDDNLPNWLGEAARRTVEPTPGNENDGTSGAGGRAAAWGDPAVILRCGVPEPDALRPDSACTTIEGVDWFAEEAERGYVFTTVGRQAHVEVSIPDDYRPESDLLVDLAPAIDESDPVLSPCT